METVACDPQSLNNAARCFTSCIPATFRPLINIYLMQQAALLSSSTPQQLLAAANSFQKLNGSDALAIEVYVLALLAGGSTDPSTLANAARCYQCQNDGMMQDVATYLLAVNNNISPVPATLLTSAQSYTVLWGADFYVLAYLYAQAGVASGVLTASTATVDSLVNAARCFLMCVQSVPLLAMLDYLLCQVNAIGGFAGQGPNLVPPGSIYSGTATFDLAVNPNTCYQVCWGPDEVSVSLTTSKQVILSTGAGTCTNVFTDGDTVMHFVGTAAGLTVTATVKGCPCGTCPPQPYNFTFANDLVGGTTTASWGAYPPGMVKTELWTSSDNITYALAATVNAPTTTASVAQPTAGNFLWGKIRHLNASNQASNFTGPLEVSGLLNGLVSYWNMNSIQVAPNGQIDNFGSNNLINHLNNAVVQLAGGGLVGGAGDWHTNLAGSPYLKLTPAPANLRLGGANSMTGAMWVKFISNGNNAGIFGVFNPASEYLLWFNTTPALEWNVRNGAGVNVPLVIGNQTLNTWHLIVVGVDNANSQIFYSIDGGARVNAACIGTLANQVPAFELGNYADGFPSDIFMDEVGWWNRVLNAAEITFLYNGGAGKTLPL